ncbi:molybdenum cofactor guanylyltransferase [Spiractinospora alimapuensis]|uniref:molybdenum cofactor guanylyltransferase n=1 Tax=Spiractinospora alimapuensis TaxID=2820884 RepID=UPI001F22DDE4|nr:molybdenum cofactor guanylyltransferase [Spiractinospora alimapuensis]QVQ53014.1 molybdenum cofactor guanylyltransferase [Spiractinospora alimapuensis]
MIVHPYDAVILAGGRARRMDHADKPGARVGDRSLLERVADAVSDAEHLVVVGPPRPSPAARYVREDPPGSGPVSALRVGLAEVRAPAVALLAADMPFLAQTHLRPLWDALASRDGAVLGDASAHPQWLAGVWRTDSLRSALRHYTGGSLRGVLSGLDFALVTDGGHAAFDCDTPEDLAEARRRLR